jgi:two-component sensor histidine kinase
VAVGIDLRWLEALARRAELPPDGTVTALGPDGAVLVHHVASPGAGRSEPARETAPPEELRRRMVALGTGAIRGVNAAAEPRVYGLHRTDTGGLVVAVGMPPYVLFARYGAALRDTLAAPLTILVLALAAAWWGAEALITRWVRALSRAAKRMAGGDLSARSNVPHDAYEIGELAAAFDGMAEAIERERERLRAALGQRETLLRELNHRIKNAFALVQAIAVRTLRHSPDPEAFERAFLGRLDALARGSTLLAAADGGGKAVELRALAEAALVPHRAEDGLRLSGPAVTVPAPTAQTLGLVLHELATNAAKYGALSVPEGRVELAWRVEAVPEEGRRLVLEWAERGGPEVRPPERRGFGRSLIERSVAYELGGTARLEFPPAGVRCRIELPLTPAR